MNGPQPPSVSPAPLQDGTFCRAGPFAAALCKFARISIPDAKLDGNRRICFVDLVTRRTATTSHRRTDSRLCTAVRRPVSVAIRSRAIEFFAVGFNRRRLYVPIQTVIWRRCYATVVQQRHTACNTTVGQSVIVNCRYCASSLASGTSSSFVLHSLVQLNLND